MNKMVLAYFCCFAANAFASSADSGRCPWPIPFHIAIHAVGSIHNYKEHIYPHGVDEYTDNGTGAATNDLNITVDTFISSYTYFQEKTDFNDNLQYSLHADTLRFSYQYDDTSNFYAAESASLLIIFARGKDSIISLTYHKTDIRGAPSVQSENVEEYTFQISSMLFDDTSIYTTDSSFRRHGISTTDFETQSYFYSMSFHEWGDFLHNDFTASSVNLSGIFRPTHLADEAIVAIAPQGGPLSITSSNGSLHCSFEASPYERLLEIFSPLGIKASSCSVSPGQTEAVVWNIHPGFYFVRLGSSLIKVYIAG